MKPGQRVTISLGVNLGKKGRVLHNRPDMPGAWIVLLETKPHPNTELLNALDRAKTFKVCCSADYLELHVDQERPASGLSRSGSHGPRSSKSD